MSLKQKWLGGLAALALVFASAPAALAEDMSADEPGVDIESENPDAEVVIPTDEQEAEPGVETESPDAEVVIPTEPGEPGAVVVPEEEDALSPEEEDAIEEEVQEEVVPREETIVVTQPRGRPPLDNVIVEIGGGASTFTGELGDVTEGGAGWTGRAVIGARTMLGFELSYFGAANTIEGLDVGISDLGDLDTDNTVISSAGEGLVRLNFLGARAPVKPFVAGGANYTRFDSDTLFDNTEALGFPLAAGVQFYMGNFTVGARGDYRILTDLIDENVPDGNQWGGMLTVGANF